MWKRVFGLVMTLALLTAVASDFGNRYPVYADSDQGFFDFIQLVGLNDSFNFFHMLSLLVS